MRTRTEATFGLPLENEPEVLHELGVVATELDYHRIRPHLACDRLIRDLFVGRDD